MTRNGVKRNLIPEKLSIQHQLEILCFLCVNNYVEFDTYVQQQRWTHACAGTRINIIHQHSTTILQGGQTRSTSLIQQR